MRLRAPQTCDAHREALTALVDRHERLPATEAALDHLDRCDSCVAELEAIAEAVHALRGIGREAALADPPDDIWPGLAARVRRPGEPAWRWRMPLAGLVATAAVVALLVGPGAVWQTRLAVMQEAGTNASLLALQRNTSIQLERRFQRYRAPIVEVEPIRSVARSSVPPLYPDGWFTPGDQLVPNNPIDPTMPVRAE